MKKIQIVYCNCGSKKPVSKPRPKPQGGNTDGTDGAKGKD